MSIKYFSLKLTNHINCIYQGSYLKKIDDVVCSRSIRCDPLNEKLWVLMHPSDLDRSDL